MNTSSVGRVIAGRGGLSKGILAMAVLVLACQWAVAAAVRDLVLDPPWRLSVPNAIGAAADPSLGRIAILQTNGTAEILDARTHQRLATIPPEPNGGPIDRLAPTTHNIRFSGDGRWLALVRNGSVRVVAADGGKGAFALGARAHGISFSDRGGRALVLGPDSAVFVEPAWKEAGELRIRNRPLPSDAPVLRPLVNFGPPKRPIATGVAAISPDGSEVALGQMYHEVERWDVASGRMVSFGSLAMGGPTSTSSRVTSLGYAPSGGRLVAVLDGRDVVLAEASGETRVILRQPYGARSGTRSEVSEAFFTPDGTELVLVVEILGLGPGPFGLALEKTTGAEVQFWNVGSGTPSWRMKATGPSYFGKAWVSADGLRVLALQYAYKTVPRSAAERQTIRLENVAAVPVVVGASLANRQ